MPRMQITHEGPRVIIGPCPGCEMWTLEWLETERPFDTEVELILSDHLDLCTGLQEIVYNTL